MTTLKRTALILVAAFAVVGLLVGFSKTSWATSLTQPMPRNRDSRPQNIEANIGNSTSDAQPAALNQRPQGRAGGSPSAMAGLMTFLPHIGIVCSIVVLIQLGTLAWTRLKPSARSKSASAMTSPPA